MLIDLVYRAAEAQPRATAMINGDERLTRLELVEQIERLADGLAELGIGPQDAVAVVLANRPEFVFAMYAITGLGAVMVPVNPQLKPEELAFRFRQCKVKAVICEGRIAASCQRILAAEAAGVPVITAGPGGDREQPTVRALIERGSAGRLAPRAAHEPFVYQFSSGSTGRPKRVVRTHGNVTAEARMFATTMHIGDDDAVFCAVPLFHDYGMTCCLLASAPTGARLVMLEDPNPFLLKRDLALELLERERPTVFPGVPFNFRMLADASRDADLSSLRLCFSAGAALPRSTFDAFLERFGVPVRQLYGCSEAGAVAANLDPDPIATFASVGRPLGDAEIIVLGDDLLPVAPGAIGELALSSPALMTGYADLDELNAAVFRDGRFLTGDLGRVDDEGRIHLTGRKKLLIDVGGYKVDPVEVEDVLNAYPAVSEAVVVGVPGDHDGEQKVKAAVVRAADCDARELTRFCAERLANYKVPQIVEFREEIPRSPTGKILRQYLIDAAAE